MSSSTTAHPYDEDCECLACYTHEWDDAMGDIEEAIESGYLDKHLKTIARYCLKRADSIGVVKSSGLKAAPSTSSRPFGMSDEAPALQVTMYTKVPQRGRYQGSGTLAASEFRAFDRVYRKKDFVGKLVNIKWDKVFPPNIVLKVINTGKGTSFAAQVVWTPPGFENLYNKMYRLSYSLNQHLFEVK